MLRGTYVKDEAGSFNGVVECFGTDSSGRVMILIRSRQLDEAAKQIYEYYLKLEQIVIPNPKVAETRLRNKITSLMHVTGEEAFTTNVLLNFAKKDGTLEKFVKKWV